MDGARKGFLRSVPGAVPRAFSRVDRVPPAERPTGYGWGYVFAGANAAATLAVGGLALAFGVLFAPSGAQASFIRFAARVLAAGFVIGAVVSGCAFARRCAACYLVVVVWLAAAAVLLLAQAVLSALAGSWLYVPAYAVGLAAAYAWLVYFGNRRHMFGYLREPDRG